MYELHQVGENTYYVECPAKVGLYHLGEGKVCLIDSGSDKDAAKKVLKHLTERGWELQMILSTHFHADHIGGNRFLQERTGCPIYAAGLDRVFMEHTILEPMGLWAGCPPRVLRNKFLMAQESTVQELSEAVLPPGLSMIRLDGHSPAMTGICTDDGVWFLADALTGEEILEKYHISFLYDPEEYLKTLDRVEALEGRLFIPTHGSPCENIRPLVAANREKCLEVMALVKNLCRVPVGIEELLKRIFDHYGLTLDLAQYVLSGSTLRSYLACLLDRGEIEVISRENRILWQVSGEA
jgi:glyoxylase-like metal-dependent hydrolase (beta-lactamase superfamily II)